MRTEFVTFVHSVSVSLLDRFNVYDNNVKDEFNKSWDKSLNEYAEKYSLTWQEAHKHSLSKNNIHDDGSCGPIRTLYFIEDVELPKENFTFLQLLQKNCKDKELVIVVMDKITREREIFD